MPTGEPLSSSGFQVRPGDVLDVGKTFARGIFGGVVGAYHLWKSDPVTAALRQVLGVEEGSASDIAAGVLNPAGAGPAALRSLDARLKKAVENGSLPEWMGRIWVPLSSRCWNPRKAGTRKDQEDGSEDHGDLRGL